MWTLESAPLCIVVGLCRRDSVLSHPTIEIVTKMPVQVQIAAADACLLRTKLVVDILSDKRNREALCGVW